MVVAVSLLPFLEAALHCARFIHSHCLARNRNKGQGRRQQQQQQQ